MANPDSRLPRRVPNPFEAAPDLRGLVEEFEGQLAEGMERLVAGEGFSELLVAVTENTVGLWRISADFWDLVLRGLRLPGRTDIDRLARQLARTEDKLELLLQAVEQLQDRQDEAQRAGTVASATRPPSATSVWSADNARASESARSAASAEAPR